MAKLSFQPQFFCQIQGGDHAGAWAPIIPGQRDTRHTVESYREEARRIGADGGVVSFADGGSIGLMAAIEKALEELPVSSAESK